MELSSPLSGAMQLILEKICLPRRTAYLCRRRLLRSMDQSISNCSSTIVVGRAGTGKTTLAADFAGSCGRAVAWYKVDAPESESQLFFQYLCAAIQQQRPRFGSVHLSQALQAEVLEDYTTIADAFVFELLQTELVPLLIVIEDLHLIYDANWVVPFFSRLLSLLPTDAHVLITSRTLPPAPLWRMRSKQSLCVIEEPELAFTREEAIDFFQLHGLSPDQAMIALDHTHGRVGALQLCVESLSADQRDAEARSLADVWAK